MVVRFLTRLSREDEAVLTGLMAEHLGVDLEQIPAGFTCEYFGGSSPVVVSWEGRSAVDADVFEHILELADVARDA